MTAIRASEWRKLPLSLTELCIDTSLRCGQSFRWRKISDEWHCTLHGRIISLKQDPDHLHYRVTWPKALATPLTPMPTPKRDISPVETEVDDTEALLRNYFNLKYDLTKLYEQWAEADPNFRKRAPKFTGVRMLNQDAWEALIGFICSSNNNISRISQMVHKLCLHYGPFIGKIGDDAFYDFPTPEALTDSGVEAHLRELGFGYRAKYISETARVIAQQKPHGWLGNLRNPASIAWGAVKLEDLKGEDMPTYKNAHEQLLQLMGVGPKVADCVCLMGLGWGEAVPVDTHVWQIAMRDYKFGGKSKNKTLTKALYDAVGDHFRELWGNQAGWAHSVLFTADLRTFSDRLVEKKEDTDVKVKTESVNGMALDTPAATPPKKRRVVTTEAKIEMETKVKLECEDDSLAVVSTTRTSKRRKMKA